MPDGWLRESLGDLIVLEYGKGLKEDARDGGQYPVVSSAGVVGYHSHPLVESAPVIVVGRKGSAGTVHWSDAPCWPIDTTFWVRPVTERLDPEFLYLLLQQADLPAICAQTGVPGLSRDRAYEVRVDVPPLVVQRRVVDLVDAVDTYAAAARMLASSSESLIEALESEVMDSGEHHRALGEVTQFAGGYAFSPSRQGNNEGEVPFYKVSDMNALENHHTMTISANYVSDEVLAEMRAKAWPAGTVVFPKVGAALLTEKRRVLGTRAAFDNNVMGLVTLPDIRPDYPFSYMRTVRLGNYAQQGAVPSVNQSHLRDLVIPVPPLEDQDEFISNVSAARSILEAAVAEADALSRLRSALLGELLSDEREIPELYDELVGLVA